jgi:hypothetical protein
MSPRASESALTCMHWVHSHSMIAANDRTLNLTKLYWSQIYSILQRSCFAMYWTESIPHHWGHMNCESLSPQTKKVSPEQELIRTSPFGRQDSDKSLISYLMISHLTLHISRYSSGLTLRTSHLTRNEPFEHMMIVLGWATWNKLSCWEWINHWQ